MRGVEPHGGRAVIIAAERDIIDADQIADMLHRLGTGTRVGRAHRALPIADADNATGFGDSADFFIGQVAVDLARGLHSAVAGYDRSLRHRQHFSNAGMRQMRDIDDHALGFHPLDNIAAERRKPALLQPVHRSAKLVVEEMRQPRHAETRIVKPV